MQIARVLKPVGLTLVLSVCVLPLVAAAQPDIKQNAEQCMKAKTAKECQAALPACERVLAACEQACEQAPGDPQLDEVHWRVLTGTAWCENQVKNYPAAEGHYRSALAVIRRQAGPEPAEVATILNNLAAVLASQSKYQPAETLYRQALAMRQTLLGAEHPALAESLNNLAALLASQGKYEPAETLYRQALAILQKVPGAAHPGVPKILNNLVGLLERQGKTEPAKTMYQQALAIKQKLLGAERPALVAAPQRDIKQDVDQCIKAETAQACQVALPACRRVLAVFEPAAPNDPELDAIQVRVLRDTAWCEEQVGNYPAAEGHYRRALAMRRSMHGPEHMEVANSLNSLATVLSSQGKYEAAEALLRQALAMRQKLLGAMHLEVANSLNNLADVLLGQGKYEEAETLHRQALSMVQKLLGLEHPNVATSLNNLGGVLLSQGKYEQAETLFRQALAMRQKLLGAEHPDVATSLNNLATALSNRGKYEAAETLLRQALAMMQKMLGAEHTTVASSINNLAVVLSSQGKYEAAAMLYQRALAMRQKLLGAEHPDVATSLNNLADVLSHQGKYATAEMLYRQALAMLQKLLGAEHPAVATCLNNLATVLSSQGKDEQAETLYRQALALKQKLLGAEHPDLALALDNLAGVLSDQGKYGQAEVLLRQALAMRQKLLEAEHPDVAVSLDSLAGVLSDQGKYEQAETWALQALAMRQKLLGDEHPDVGVSLNNLAYVLARQGKYAQAEKRYLQALAMMQKLLETEHPDIAQIRNNLAAALSGQGKYEQAETLFRQVLAIMQKALDAEHPHVATSLNNLATVLESQGKYEQAEMLYRRALAIRQKLLGDEHHDVATSLTFLANMLICRGQFPAALPLFAQAASIQEKLLRTTSSETRMRAALSLVRGAEGSLYGLLLAQPAHGQVQRLVLTTALLRKGRAAEAGTFANRLFHESQSNRQLQDLYYQWQQLRQQREALLYGDHSNLSTAAYQARLRELSQQADDLESQLGAAMPELRNLQPPTFDAILPAVAARLPSNGVLVEVVWAQPRNFQATGTESRLGPPHYLGMVLSADQHIAVHDLGEASTIDSQVQALLAALRNPLSDPKGSAQALYNQILKPLLSADAKHLYLSLDGSLSLVPFDALHDGSDYLLGRRSFHYLTSGRDLLRTDAERTKQAALVLADPDFGKAAQSPGTVGADTFYKKLSTLRRLPGARREAEQVGQLLSCPPLFDGAAAESIVRAAHAPWVLHIASHGLFLNGQQFAHPYGRGISLINTRKGVLFGDFGTASLTMSGDTDSLSGSALVLAGAAQGGQAKSAAEDGLLTAEEARSLDLFGTQLVVLSACDTGQGDLSVGQGVYGLRRAFLVAGAETLVTSLWQVSDAATGLLMEQYYRKLLVEKKGRLEGMQEAMSEMKAKYRHPYYWAPFLVIGNDGPLRPPVGLSPG